MKKKIGVKVIVSLICLFILFCINSTSDGFAKNQALGGMTRIHDNWTQIERLNKELAIDIDSCELHSGMIAFYPETETTAELSFQLQEKTEEMIAVLDKIETIVNGVSGWDLNGISKEEIQEAFLAHKKSVNTVIEKTLNVTNEYLTHGQPAAQTASIELSNAVKDAAATEETFINMVINTSESIVVDREKVVALCGKIASASFFAFIVISLLSLVFINRTVARVAKSANDQLSDIIEKINKEDGDLTSRIVVKSEDEIGNIVNGVNTFIMQLQGVMLKIRDGSGRMNELVSVITNEIDESNSNAENISATMQELSASMEEVAATLDEITTGIQHIFESSKQMSEDARSGKDFVSKVKENAVVIRSEAEASKQNTTAMIAEIRNMLEVAIENSRSVNKINELTDEILSISSQTNLLALNASIEAAHAGDAGKGFAVVADEIRTLADNSRETANNIQSISGMVTDAVDELADDANKMLAFIDETVIKDYDKFVDMASSYHNDADHMDEILQTFYGNASKLAETMARMAEGIDGINIAVDESANGVTLAAQNTGQLVDALASIKSEANTNRTISEELQNEVLKFKKI